MKRYRIWLGHYTYIEAHSTSRRHLQAAWYDSFGLWVPEDRIEEMEDTTA
ncbi:hypothetical protein [Agromyces larvae]|uniref:Uncharacterized protein n=1 Tax=Agromyces larvae TaxID=2929802 RepID=A0ABY4C3F0_9MICO|nr:hypothetical protein [Agromyces larvae]UOE45915.1 hypothetical protein MTO99_09300 [Agromyces larvae]